jgi:hypothetical protein
MPDVLQIFSNAFDDAVSKSAGAYLGEAVKEHVTKLGSSALFVTVSSETAKALAEGIVGPILKIFLKALDPTQKKLDAILNEPLQTAVALTRQCLSAQIGNENDRGIRDQQFYAALQIFEKAYSIASSRKKDEEIRVYIRLAQATIAKAMNAPGWVAVYVKEFVSTLKEQIQLADAEVKRALERLRYAEALLTTDGLERAQEQSRQMIIELGPQPRPGQRPFTSLGIEMGVDDRTWQYARNGILNTAKPPTTSQLAELRKDVEMQEEKSLRLKAFARFWAISDV